MKKMAPAGLKVLAFVSLLWSAPCLFGQGVISVIGNFTRIFDCETGQRVGAGYTAGLYYAPDGTTDPGQFVLLAPTSPVVNGLFNVGNRTVPTATPGGTGLIYGAAWQTAFGSTYEQAAAVPGAKVGRSAIVSAQVTNPDPGSLVPVGIPDFQVCAVPEPSAIALGVLAVAVLFMRKARRMPCRH